MKPEEKYKDADWSLKDTVLAGHYGVTCQRIRQVRKTLGKPNPHRNGRYEHETLKHQELRAFLLAGGEQGEPGEQRESGKEIAVRFGVTHDVVYYVRSALGLTTPRPRKVFGTVPLLTREELRAWRESRGLARSELAEALGISPSTVKSYEQGLHQIPALMFRALRDLDRELGKGNRTPA